jgi:hypothetical protein
MRSRREGVGWRRIARRQIRSRWSRDIARGLASSSPVRLQRWWRWIRWGGVVPARRRIRPRIGAGGWTNVRLGPHISSMNSAGWGRHNVRARNGPSGVKGNVACGRSGVPAGPRSMVLRSPRRSRRVSSVKAKGWDGIGREVMSQKESRLDETPGAIHRIADCDPYRRKRSPTNKVFAVAPLNPRRGPDSARKPDPAVNWNECPSTVMKSGPSPGIIALKAPTEFGVHPVAARHVRMKINSDVGWVRMPDSPHRLCVDPFSIGR